MTYVIAEPCIDIKDRSCIDVCPVDCIHETSAMLVIDPEECIDCGACEPECPVEAIFPEDALPDKWEPFVKINAAWNEARPPSNVPANAYATEHNVQNEPLDRKSLARRERLPVAIRRGGRGMPQQAWSPKRERQYEHIKESLEERGSSEDKAEEIAARTVNKERARAGEAKTSSSCRATDMSSGRRGGLRSGTNRPKGRTRDQLYNEARDMNIEGRSRMNKEQLQRAVDRKKASR